MLYISDQESGLPTSRELSSYGPFNSLCIGSQESCAKQVVLLHICAVVFSYSLSFQRHSPHVTGFVHPSYHYVARSRPDLESSLFPASHFSISK